MDPNNEAGNEPWADEAGRPLRRHLHHPGSYLEWEGDVRVVYGDGTPESLATALGQVGPDPWQSELDPWEAAHRSWPPDIATDDDGRAQQEQ